MSNMYKTLMHFFQEIFCFCVNTHICQKSSQQAYDSHSFFAIPHTLGLVFLSGKTVALVVAEL